MTCRILHLCVRYQFGRCYDGGKRCVVCREASLLCSDACGMSDIDNLFLHILSLDYSPSYGSSALWPATVKCVGMCSDNINLI